MPGTGTLLRKSFVSGPAKLVVLGHVSFFSSFYIFGLWPWTFVFLFLLIRLALPACTLYPRLSGFLLPRYLVYPCFPLLSFFSLPFFQPVPTPGAIRDFSCSSWCLLHVFPLSSCSGNLFLFLLSLVVFVFFNPAGAWFFSPDGLDVHRPCDPSPPGLF